MVVKKKKKNVREIDRKVSHSLKYRKIADYLRILKKEDYKFFKKIKSLRFMYIKSDMMRPLLDKVNYETIRRYHKYYKKYRYWIKIPSFFYVIFKKKWKKQYNLAPTVKKLIKSRRLSHYHQFGKYYTFILSKNLRLYRNKIRFCFRNTIFGPKIRLNTITWRYLRANFAKWDLWARYLPRKYKKFKKRVNFFTKKLNMKKFWGNIFRSRVLKKLKIFIRGIIRSSKYARFFFKPYGARYFKFKERRYMVNTYFYQLCILFLFFRSLKFILSKFKFLFLNNWKFKLFDILTFINKRKIHLLVIFFYNFFYIRHWFLRSRYFLIRRYLRQQFRLDYMAEKKIYKLKVRKVVSNFFVTLTKWNNEVIISRSTGQATKSKKKKIKMSSFVVYDMIESLCKKIKILGIEKINLYLNSRVDKHIFNVVNILDKETKVKAHNVYYSKAIPHHFGQRKQKKKRL